MPNDTAARKSASRRTAGTTPRARHKGAKSTTEWTRKQTKAKARIGKKPAKAAKKVRRPRKLDLRDPKVRARLKEKNLACIEQRAPAMYALVRNYTPLSKLAVLDDGQPDTLFEGRYFYNKRHDEFVANQLKAFWKNPQRMPLAPLQPEQFDKTAGEFVYNVLKRSTKAGLQFSVGHSSDESYFLYVMGLGLGGHLYELVERTKCKALAILEPNLEFLVHSLEVFDWTRLFDVIDDHEGLLMIFVDNRPMVLSQQIRGWLRGINPMSVDGSTCYTHYNNPVFNAALKKLVEDRNLIVAGLGFFYDETLMIGNTHHNLYSGKERVYMRPEKSRIEAPVFVIGNGPSLDDDLDFIRENQDKAIIVSSGSALRPLVLNGILPDFQMETENIDVYPLIAQVAEDHDISKVRLVTSTTVDIQVPPVFDEVLYYFRGSLSPFPIFCDTDRRCIGNPNPTVVNASLSFAQEAGFRTFYFFGTDMGTTQGPERHHSKYAYQYTKGAIHRPQNYNIPVPGNFGGNCMASDGMYWTRDAAERAIRSYALGRAYYNCSNGSRIEGMLPMPSKLVRLKDLPGGKQPVIDEIVVNFPVYSSKEFDAHWNDNKMQKAFDAWLDNAETLMLDRKNYDDLGYLTEVMAHLSPKMGFEPGTGGPALVFRGTLMMILMAFEYYARRLPKSDVRKFEKIAREEIQVAIDYLRREAKKQFGTLSKDAAKRRKPKKPGKKSAKKPVATAARA
ncbi:MAG: motility associated factor glycosyltransferase family protein [Rhodospirillales bacterium]|nr:motility associated factor glycosyltransferase family protein [Rhodospirillales bacterium]MBI2978394.1 motility associated factor glycosyltransferase family protein [Rhodospirillales bacterium]